ncbi:MAG: penicillin acylase family protein [Planctomycetaceae bacterium]|nr:penicillin acylase family protein [Planctomycetaceae bacterium]
MSAEVEIDLDAVEIPTITAAAIEDLARAQGWLHARERFLQMDLARREAAGELWEIVPAAKTRDLETLPLQLREVARRALTKLPSTHRALLERYAEGVNARLAEAVPFEYGMLKIKPTPWRAEDSLLVQLGMARYLDSSAQADRARTPLLEALPPDVVAFLTSSAGRLDRSIDGSALPAAPEIPSVDQIDLRVKETDAAGRPETRTSIDTRTPTGLGDAAALPAQAAIDRDMVPGSNAFAVAGTRTKDGRAIVANDMHLMLMAPGIWYRVRLEWPEHLLEGLSLPGVPLIVQGTNGHVAWAFTNLTADLADLVIIERDPNDPGKYLTRAGAEPFATRTITIGSGGAAEEITLRSTRFGPIIETRPDGTMLALRWATLQEGGLDCGLFSLADARTLESALDVARHWNGPPQNFLVATRDGRIGWTIAGALPKRDARTPGIVSWRLAPMWWGVLDALEKPTIMDPPGGILTSANQLSIAPRGPLAAVIGADEAHGDRAHRIAELLGSRRDWSEADLHAVQLDLLSPRLLRWRDALLAALDDAPLPASAVRARDTLRAWNGEVAVDAAAPVLLDAVRQAMRSEIARAFCETTERRGRPIERRLLAAAIDDEAMLRILELRAEHLFPASDAPGDDWSKLAARLLSSAAESSLLPAKDGAEPAFRTRGDVNRAAIRHPAADALGAAARLAEMPRTPLPGHPTTVRVQTPTFGASQRSVVSPAYPEDAILVTPAGQSGLPTSPHFRSLHRPWQEGKSYPMRPGEATSRVRLVAKAPALEARPTATNEPNAPDAVNPSNR